ncbi:hypothetical protein ACFY3G_46530 [Streptomyces phaeochromogenes]|uniref:hypothetical protein n=1 Tax=Streptomyces phaeochromogenes TaxID=1923 RepID=UPI003699A20A
MSATYLPIKAACPADLVDETGENVHEALMSRFEFRVNEVGDAAHRHTPGEMDQPGSVRQYRFGYTRGLGPVGPVAVTDAPSR